MPFPTPLFTIVLDKKFITPYTQNWSLTVERELLRQLRARVGYVGTKATHLKSEYDQNAPIYNTNLIARPRTARPSTSAGRSRISRRSRAGCTA